MTARIQELDFARLEQDGFIHLKALVQGDELAAFERAVAVAGERLAARRGVERQSAEPISDVIRSAGRHRTMLFDHLKRLFVIEQASVEIGRALERIGLFQRYGIEVPIVWPTLRADLPGEATYELALHQDYATTRSQTAWRLWIPLRDADRHHGSMEVAPGSHRGGRYRYGVNGSGTISIDRADLSQQGLTVQTIEIPAGDGILFSPWLVHGSVRNQSQRTKWIFLLHVQDLAAFVNPDDAADPLQHFLELTERGRAIQASAQTPARPA